MLDFVIAKAPLQGGHFPHSWGKRWVKGNTVHGCLREGAPMSHPKRSHGGAGFMPDAFAGRGPSRIVCTTTATMACLLLMLPLLLLVGRPCTNDLSAGLAFFSFGEDDGEAMGSFPLIASTDLPSACDPSPVARGGWTLKGADEGLAQPFFFAPSDSSLLTSNFFNSLSLYITRCTNVFFLRASSSCCSSLFPSSLSLFDTAASVLRLGGAAAPNFVQFASAQQTVTDITAVVTFGYLRYAYPVLDYETSLAGFMAAIHHANANKMVPGVYFQLNVTTVPCYDSSSCAAMNTTNAAIVDGFLDRIGNYSAILRPSWLLSERVLAAAKRMGVIVFDPQTPSLADFSAGAEHLIHFNHYLSRQVDHLFTYMQQDYGCVYSGIVVEQFGDIDTHVARAQQLFTDGAMPKPPVVDVNTASDADLISFFTAESRRMCYMVIVSLPSFNRLIARLATLLGPMNAYDPERMRFYGASPMGGDAFFYNGSVRAFSSSHFVQWNPIDAVYSKTFVPAYTEFQRWANNRSADAPKVFVNSLTNKTHSSSDEILAHFWGGGQVPRISTTALQSWMVMKYAIFACRSAVARYFDDTLGHRLGAGSGGSSSLANNINSLYPPQPFTHADLLAVLYTETYVIEGYAFKQPVRECPQPPKVSTAATCFCNTVSSTAFMYKPNASSSVGAVMVVLDDRSLGQRDIASIDITVAASSSSASGGSGGGLGCGFERSGWSYPITGLLLYPSHYVPSATRGSTLAIMEGWHASIMNALSALVYEANYAASRPVRPSRFAPFVVDTDRYATTDEALQAYADSYRPFVVLGSLQGPITAPSVLTLFPTWLGQQEADAPLVPFAQWNPLTLALLPSLSEYIHAVAAFYAQYHVSNEARYREEQQQQQQDTDNDADGNNNDVNRFFTSVRVMCATLQEARYISQSLATFGFNVPVEQMSIMNHHDNALWEAEITQWLMGVPLPTATGSSSSSSSTIYEPFFIATTFRDENFVLSSVFKAASRLNRPAAVAIIAPDSTLLPTLSSANMTADTLASAYPHQTLVDVIFPAFRSEWWSPSARGYTSIPSSLSAHFLDPFFHMAVIGHQITSRLAEYAQTEVTTPAANILYQHSPTITVGDMTFGPFSNASCTDADVRLNTQDRLCQCKKGSRRTHIHSALDFQQRTGAGTSSRTNAFSYTLTKCGIVYKAYVAPPSPPFELSAGAIAGIAVGATALLVGLGFGAVLVNLLCFGRNNRAAPKDSTVPFAIVFTDIQSSTSLWARAPSTMSEAVVEHHAIMRRILRRNNGYEVKTVGDSFMIAFKSPSDATSFALEAQLAFNEADWSNEIDAIYVELLAEAGIGVNGEEAALGDQHNRGNDDDRGGKGFILGSSGTTTNRNDNHHLSTHGDVTEEDGRSLSNAHQNASASDGGGGRGGPSSSRRGGGCGATGMGGQQIGGSSGQIAQRRNTTATTAVTLIDDASTQDTYSQSQGGGVGGGGGRSDSPPPISYGGATTSTSNTSPRTNLHGGGHATITNTNNAGGAVVGTNPPLPPNRINTTMATDRHRSSFVGGNASAHSIGYIPDEEGGVSIAGGNASMNNANANANAVTVSASGGGHAFDASASVWAGGEGGDGEGGGGGEVSATQRLGGGESAAAVYAVHTATHPTVAVGGGGQFSPVGSSMYNPNQASLFGGSSPTAASRNQHHQNNTTANSSGHPPYTFFGATVGTTASGSASNNNNPHTYYNASVMGTGPTVNADPSVIAYPRSTAANENIHMYNDPSKDPNDHSAAAMHSTNNHNNTLRVTTNNHNNATSSYAYSNPSYLSGGGGGGGSSGTGDVMRGVDRAANPWHGLRVRIGVHYGLGDIRKDPITLGYDYYGTVVNTAARVEGVGHGGQILVTEEAYTALGDNFVKRKKALVIALGPQPLRGLDAPVTLYQFTPATLEARRFPLLRLHIEKETEDTEATDTTTQTASSEVEPPEAIAARICAAKQYSRVSTDNLLLHFYYFLAMFGPMNDKYTAQVITKLGQSWGFEKASQAVKGTNSKNKLLMAVLAKITKTFLAARKAGGPSGRRGAANKAPHNRHTTHSNSILLPNDSYNNTNRTTINNTNNNTTNNNANTNPMQSSNNNPYAADHTSTAAGMLMGFSTVGGGTASGLSENNDYLLNIANGVGHQQQQQQQNNNQAADVRSNATSFLALGAGASASIYPPPHPSSAVN